jgi:branched-chain amino acid transport system substrate-binding protein
MINFRKLVAVLLILMLVLAACVDDEPDAATDEPAPTSAPQEEAVVDEEPEPEPDQTGDAEPVFIGGIHPLTGGLAADGIQMDNAIQMAIAEINAAGGIQSLGGAQLSYLSADSTGAADVGQSEAERLMNEGASALIGAFQSAVTTNIAAVAEREGVPLVIDVALADAILDQGFSHTFRVMANATTVSTLGAQYLTEMAAATGEDVSTVAYLFEGTTGFGDSARAAFVSEAANLGLDIVGEYAYEPFAVTDLTTEMTAIDAQSPDVLVVTGYYNDGLLAANNAEDVALDVKAVYGVAQGTYDQAQFVADAGDLAECFFDANYHWDAANPEALAVRDRFQAEYGEEMRAAAFLSYQVTLVVADAIERAASADPGAIRDALADTNYADHLLPFPGPIQFDETGENINARPILMQVQNGQVLQVWPPDQAEADPIFPCTSWNQ